MSSARSVTALLVALAAALVAILGATAPAEAATITYSGGAFGTVVYAADPGESLDTSVGYEAGCFVEPGQVYDCVTFFGDAITSAPGPCIAEFSGVESCVLDPNHSGVQVRGGPGADSVSILDAGLGGFPAGTPYAITVDGGEGNDHLLGGSAGETLNGEGGADAIAGMGGGDAIDGGEGNDVLGGDSDEQHDEVAEGGDDVIHGGPGDDQLTGDASSTDAVIGHDVLDGGPGVDTATSGWYRFDGHGGDEDPPPTVSLDGLANDGRPGENDNLVAVERVSTGYQPATAQPGVYVGSEGADEFNLVFANGTVAAAGGDDRITGSDSADSLDGGAGADQISGGFGDDVITGGPGPDDIGGDRTAACFYGPIFGICTIGSGNDTIYAQDGERDTVDCGPGADLAYVDPIDVTTGCETLRVAAGPAAGTGAAGSPSKSKANPTKPSLRVPHLSLTAIARQRAIHLRCGLARAGRCTVRAWIAGRVARKLHLESARRLHPFTLGVGSATLRRRGNAPVVVHLRPKVAARLRRARSLRLLLTATAHYAEGASEWTRRYNLHR